MVPHLVRQIMCDLQAGASRFLYFVDAILLFFLPLFGTAIFSFVFNQEDSLILALLSSFFIAYLYELNAFDNETYYQKMRLILSIVVIVSHIGVLIIN